MDDDFPGYLKALAVLLSVAAAALLTWWTVLAFVGGTLWPTGIEVRGGLGTGLLWLFVIDPLVATVLYWIALAVVVPLAVADGAVRGRRG